MTSPIAGIDPHQDNFTIGIVDPNGFALTHQAFDHTSLKQSMC